MTRQLLSLPWSYWRFPRGAKSARTLPVYGGQGALEFRAGTGLRQQVPDKAARPRLEPGSGGQRARRAGPTTLILEAGYPSVTL